MVSEQSEGLEQMLLPESSGADQGVGLEDLIQGKARILRTKLEIFGLEIADRLLLRERNLRRIDDESTRVLETLGRLSRLVKYQLRQQRDVDSFYRQQFNLEQERRSQDVDCWRDIAPVMRDFLNVWEALEQAKARAMFLNNAGPRTAESL